MNNMKDIDIIVPVHKYNKEISVLLERCLKSILDSASKNEEITHNIILITTPEICTLEYKNEVTEFIEHPNNLKLNFVENKSGDYDFCSQINYAVKNSCVNEYFMIVEFDDKISSKWLKMVSPYIKNRNKCPMFLPLVETYDMKNPDLPLYYINEIGWSSSFVENELGVLTNEILKDYCNFNITGSIIKKNEFIKAGGLKPSMKLSFGYELMLRLSNLYKELFVVPKVGYFHFINREDSLTSEYHKTMTQEEGSWWINLAIEEYTFKQDRKKTYSIE